MGETVRVGDMDIPVIRCPHLPPGTSFVLTQNPEPCPFCIKEGLISEPVGDVTGECDSCGDYVPVEELAPGPNNGWQDEGSFCRTCRHAEDET